MLFREYYYIKVGYDLHHIHFIFYQYVSDYYVFFTFSMLWNSITGFLWVWLDCASSKTPLDSTYLDWQVSVMYSGRHWLKELRAGMLNSRRKTLGDLTRGRQNVRYFMLKRAGTVLSLMCLMTPTYASVRNVFGDSLWLNI